MKKFSFLLLALTAHAAQASHHGSQHFNGFYLSAAGGGTLIDVDASQQYTLTVPAAGVTILEPAEFDVEGGGASGLLGVGYEHQFHQHWVLGAEVTAGATNASVTHRDAALLTDTNLTSKLVTNLRNDFALLFKPGYVFKGHTQLYALIGPRWGNFESTLTTNVITSTLKDSVSNYELGITAGVGMEHMLTNNLSLGLEYAYTSYGSIESPTTNFTGSINSSTFNTTDETDIKVSSNTVQAVLSYHF